VLVLQILVFVAGLALVIMTVIAAIKMVILPRSGQSMLSRGVFRTVRAVFDLIARESRSYEVRDRTMAMYAPITLVLMAATWFTLIAIGYTLMFLAVDPWNLADAYHLSGSSITTLGFAPADSTLQRTLAFTEAGLGLFTLTLMITYLPSMYQAFSRREAEVALLEVRAGSPPSAVEFIIRHYRIGWLEDLDATWLDWERWFNELEESHTSYAALVFFRSPSAARSWVTAAGTILDSASLMAAAVDDRSMQGPKGVCIRAGYLALRSIADFFGIAYDPDPEPTDPISITRADFNAALDELAEAGVPLLADRDQAWRDYSGWRVNYDTVLLALAEITMAPYAPWTADRSGPAHNRPRIKRFGAKSR
jgi:hypothetical protein